MTIESRSRRTGRIARRIARRTVLRHPGRSVLIALMVAIPIAGMSGGVTVIASTMPTVEEQLEYTLGSTEAKIEIVSPPDPTLRQSPTFDGWYEVDRDPNSGDPVGYEPGAPTRSIEEILPPGTEILSLRYTDAAVRTATGLGRISVLQGDAGHPALDGRTTLVDGRIPRTDREVAVSAGALERLGVEIGDEVQVVDPRPLTLEVVGVIDDAVRSDHESELFVPQDVITGDDSDVPLENSMYGMSYHVPELRLEWDDVRDLNAQGAVVYSRAVVLDPPPPGDGVITNTGSWTDRIPSGYANLLALAAGFTLFEVCLLAGAAFLVGTRSDQRALATIASVGGDRRLLFRSVSASGAVLGLVGGFAGVGVGIAGAAVVVALLDAGNAAQFPGFHVEPVALALVLAVGVISGWIASLAAARAATRIDVVAALRGSRRPVEARARRTAAGVIIALAGAVVLGAGGVVNFLAYRQEDGHTFVDPNRMLLGITLLVVGAVVIQLGIAVLSPVLLRAASRILARIGTGARIAGRDASRNHARSVPVLAAIMSTVFAASALMVLMSSGQAALNATYPYSAPPGAVEGLFETIAGDGAPQAPSADAVAATERIVTGVFPGADVVVLEGTPAPPGWDGVADAVWTFPLLDPEQDCAPAVTQGVSEECALPQTLRYVSGQRLLVLDAPTLELVLERPLSADERRVLVTGGAIALHAAFVTADDTVEIETRPSSDFGEGEILPSAGAAIQHHELHAIVATPLHVTDSAVVISPDTAEDLGIEPIPMSFIAMLDHAPTDAERDALDAGLSTLPEGAPSYGRYEGGPPQFGDTFAWGALGLSALVTLASSAIAIGLARTDARRDDEVLDAVGSPPRLRRSIAFWQAIVVAGLGSILGVAVGLLPALALVVPTVVFGSAATGASGALTAFDAPWLQLALAAVLVPLLIASGSWLTTRRGRKVSVRRVA